MFDPLLKEDGGMSLIEYYDWNNLERLAKIHRTLHNPTKTTHNLHVYCVKYKIIVGIPHFVLSDCLFAVS